MQNGRSSTHLRPPSAANCKKVIEQLIRIFVEQSEAFLIFLLHHTLFLSKIQNIFNV